MSDAGAAIVWLFVLIGIYAAVQYLYDNLRSPISIIWGLLFGENLSLRERFGPWAGEMENKSRNWNLIGVIFQSSRDRPMESERNTPRTWPVKV